MSNICFNNEQLLAIEKRNSSLLVSAAAGSGKTAVLVERIIRKIVDEKVNVNELLVVTFTNMAANGILDARHVTILMPCFFLLGAQLQYMGRLLGVADVPKRYWPLLMSASLLNALCAMLVMNWFFA